jgi:hypothetical protein
MAHPRSPAPGLLGVGGVRRTILDILLLVGLIIFMVLAFLDFATYS